MHIKRTCLCAAFLFFLQSIHAQGLVWAKRMGGTNDEEGHSVVVDKDGNVYSTGLFIGTADFDPGPGVANLISAGNRDVYVQKLDQYGNLVWVKRIGGQDNDFGMSLTVDSSGNVFLAGTYSDDVDFDPGPGTFMLSSPFDLSLFILKLDSDGNFGWVKSVVAYPYTISIYDTYGKCIQVDDAGNIYVTAGFTGTTDFDPGPGVFELTAAGSWDAFVLKLDASGNLVWVRPIGSTSYDNGHALAVDKAGNVFSTGYYSKTADFDPGPGVFNLTSLGGRDVFVQKLDSAGNFVWAKSIGVLYDDDYGHDLSLDPDGNVLVTGTFNDNSMDFDPGPGVFTMSSPNNNSVFILKLNTDGAFVWAKQLGASTGGARARGICTDLEGNVYSTGHFSLTVDFDPGPETFLLSAAQLYDVFICKLDSAGNFALANKMGGTAEDNATSIFVDPYGDIYTTGSFRSTADFDPNSDVLNLVSAGMRDIFVAKQTQYWNFHGIIFNDLNLNGVRDADEPLMPQVKVMAKQRGIFATTNNQGEYHMYYDVVDDTLRVLPGPYWYWSVEPPYAVPSSPQQPLDFAVSIPSGIIDVGITAIELTPFRRGFDSEVLIQAHNYGSATADSILIAFDVQTMPAPLEYVSAVPSPLLVSGDYLVWLLDSLAPGATTTVQLVLHAPLSTAIGTLVSYDVQADLANDGYMKNNYFGTRSPVVGSFDPNDKRVSPENLPVTALDTAELLYVIRFQNTGTFPADFVVIRDSLPPKLNPATLNVIASSHPCTWQLEGYGYLEVRFDPIFLPDSTSNEPASHGFVAFTAQPRPYLLSGDLVRNRAGIYFDFNEPIITDYAVTKIETVTGMSEATPAGEPLAIGLSPNPVSRHAAARVEWPLDAPAPAVVEVLDLQGRRMQHTKVPAGNQQVLLDVLSPGAYWVRVRAAGRTGVKLLVAE